MSKHSEWAMRVADQLSRWPRTMARRLFPTQPNGYVLATKSLATIAKNVSMAEGARSLDKAAVYQARVDVGRRRLPAWAKDLGNALAMHAEGPFEVLWKGKA